jgi:hypothetical protein
MLDQCLEVPSHGQTRKWTMPCASAKMDQVHRITFISAGTLPREDLEGMQNRSYRFEVLSSVFIYIYIYIHQGVFIHTHDRLNSNTIELCITSPQPLNERVTIGTYGGFRPESQNDIVELGSTARQSNLRTIYVRISFVHVARWSDGCRIRFELHTHAFASC